MYNIINLLIYRVLKNNILNVNFVDFNVHIKLYWLEIETVIFFGHFVARACLNSFDTICYAKVEYLILVKTS